VVGMSVGVSEGGVVGSRVGACDGACRAEETTTLRSCQRISSHPDATRVAPLSSNQGSTSAEKMRIPTHLGGTLGRREGGRKSRAVGGGK
jgi:hypothetical protein